jgi:hypothetical protein
MLSPIDLSRFATAQAADAAGVPLGTLAMQLKRGDIALSGDEVNEQRHPGTGRSRVFSARRILHIALTAELARAGVSIKLASHLALAFTDHAGADSFGSAEIGDTYDGAEMGRTPGHLINGAETVFRVLFHADGREPVPSVDRLADVKANPFGRDSTQYRAVVMVDLDDLAERTLHKLGLPMEVVR